MLDLDEFKSKIKNKYFTVSGKFREELINLVSHYIGEEYELDIPSIDYKSMLSFVKRNNDLTIVSPTKKAIVEGNFSKSVINIYNLEEEKNEPEIVITGSYYEDESNAIRIYEYSKNGGLYYCEVKINKQSFSNRKIYYKCSLVVNYYKPETFSIFKGYEQNSDILENLSDICLYPDMAKEFETINAVDSWSASEFIKKVVSIKEEMKDANKSEDENNIKLIKA